MAFKKLTDQKADGDGVGRGKKKKAGTALMTMADVEKMYAVESKVAADAAPVAGGVPMISTRGEQFQIGENFLPDPLEAIVVLEAIQNVYYDSPYEEANPTSPACVAIAHAEKNADSFIVSHEGSPNRQGGVDFKCQGCEMNQFGSADIGKGKACNNYRRLALVQPNDKGFEDAATPLTYAIMNLPPTSLGDWGKFVQGLDRVEHRPPHGVIIKFAFDRKNPDANKRKRVIAIGYQPITDVSMALKVKALRDELMESKVLLRPPPFDNYVEPGSKATPTNAGRKAATKGKPSRPKAAPAVAGKAAGKKRAGARF